MANKLSLPKGKWGIVFERKGTTSDAVYDQLVTLYSAMGTKLGTFKGSSTPNPFKPKNPTIKGTSAYPFVKEGIYPVTHGFHRGIHALVVNNNGNVPTTTLNPNFPNQGANATYIHIHWGYKKTWKGSAGCPTIHPLEWNSFLTLVPQGQGFVIIPSTI
jgi:hypothetical protein